MYLKKKKTQLLQQNAPHVGYIYIYTHDVEFLDEKGDENVCICLHMKKGVDFIIHLVSKKAHQNFH